MNKPQVALKFPPAGDFVGWFFAHFIVIGTLALVSLAGPATAETKILFLGDSITEGYNLPREQSYPALVETELKRRGHHDVVCINAGISGSTTASGLSRLKWQLNSVPKPQILVLALGANDGLRGLDLPSATKHLTDVIHLAQKNGMRVLLAGMKMPPNYGEEFTRNYEKLFVDLAKAEDVALIPFLLEGVAGNRELNLADGIHPNAKGYEIVAKTVLTHLEPLLTSPSSTRPGTSHSKTP